MPGPRWKAALSNLTEAVSLRRLTARVALSAGLLGIAMQPASDAGAQPRVPLTPAFTPEAEVRKFRGRYVLRRSATSFFMHLAGHRSHSSHASHASHASHYSGSGSHYSSSPTPAPSPVPLPLPQPAPEPIISPQPEPQPQPQPRPRGVTRSARSASAPKPAPLFSDDFRASAPDARWKVGVLATPPSTYDPDAEIGQREGALHIATLAERPGSHFTGYRSSETFDLTTAMFSTELRRVAVDGVTIFAAAIDSANWVGFRIEGGRLSMESHTAGKVASRKVTLDAASHRFLRLRTSGVGAVLVWETSGDGVNWSPEYVETSAMRLTSLHVVLSAGTTRPIARDSLAIFDNVLVEPRQ
jgi:hypothetical protein